RLIGNDGGVVSGVFNLESFGVEALDLRPRHDQHYHEACVSVRELHAGLQSFRSIRRIVPWSDRLFRSPLSGRELTLHAVRSLMSLHSARRWQAGKLQVLVLTSSMKSQ